MGRLIAAPLSAFFLLVAAPVRADEGMWTFDNFPRAKVQATYGFAPSKAWLDHVRLGALRIGSSCSASFVSPNGLILTNQHCAVPCLESISSQEHDYSANGFYAKTQADEVPCHGFEIDQLVAIQHVTKNVQSATAGKSRDAFTAAMRAENAKLLKACATNRSIRCDVVPLYHGGVYDLYKYRRYLDIRLAFAPEFSIAQFGGDPDNFNFPRFDFDMALLRAYVGGRPVSSPDYFRFDPSGSRAGDLVFLPGNPGSTQREQTIAQLAYQRRYPLPRNVAMLAELRERLEQFQKLGAEQTRESNELLFFLDNDYKVISGELAALNDPAFFASLKANEDALRAKVSANRELRTTYGGAWDKLAAIQTKRAQMSTSYPYKSGARFNQVTYFRFAQTLVRYPIEKAKPNAQRLPEFSDTSLETLSNTLFDPSPIYPDVEELQLAFQLDMMRRDLGADDPFVKEVLAGRSPLDQAHYLVSNTRLGDVAARKALFDGGEAAVEASTDPFIQFARAIDPTARAIRKQFEDDIDNPTTALTESIAKARFAISGTTNYPDATFTLRLSYGKVAGFSDEKGTFGPYTTIGGLFSRSSDTYPYVLPKSWTDAKSSLDLSTAMNLSTTVDATGGDSGSALIDRKAQIVGLLFDGNIHALGGAYGFDPRLNRAIAVDSRAIIEGLSKVYHADRLVRELTSSSPAGRAPRPDSHSHRLVRN